MTEDGHASVEAQAFDNKLVVRELRHNNKRLSECLMIVGCQPYVLKIQDGRMAHGSFSEIPLLQLRLSMHERGTVIILYCVAASCLNCNTFINLPLWTMESQKELNVSYLCPAI